MEQPCGLIRWGKELLKLEQHGNMGQGTRGDECQAIRGKLMSGWGACVN